MSNLATLKPFVKGDPRINRRGNYKGTKWLTTKLEDALRQRANKRGKTTVSDLLVKRELKNAIVDGEQRAIEHIWDRVEGKPQSNDAPQTNALILVVTPETMKRYGITPQNPG